MFQLSAKVAASNWMQNVAIVFPKETKKKNLFYNEVPKMSVA